MCKRSYLSTGIRNGWPMGTYGILRGELSCGEKVLTEDTTDRVELRTFLGLPNPASPKNTGTPSKPPDGPTVSAGEESNATPPEGQGRPGTRNPVRDPIGRTYRAGWSDGCVRD